MWRFLDAIYDTFSESSVDVIESKDMIESEEVEVKKLEQGLDKRIHRRRPDVFTGNRQNFSD